MTDRERRNVDGFGLIYVDGKTDKQVQEHPLPVPAVHYDRPESLYPDSIRLSFPDGKTIVYDRRIKQPDARRYLNMPRHAKRG